MNKKRIFKFCVFVLFIGLFPQSVAFALDNEKLDMYSKNHILFYDPDDCISSGSINFSICGATLPTETIKILESAQVREKAEQNIERYRYAEEKTGLPWQVVAALHFREAGMRSDRSISNGQRLGNYINIDKVRIYADPNQDAENAANIFIRNVKNVYGIDIIANPSSENYAWGFLAYNRGAMYKCNGNVSYDKSPYVMNFYDDSHMRMSWITADSRDCKGNALNNIAGAKNAQVGALAVLAYLCGDDSIEGTSNESISESDTPSDINPGEFKWYGQCDPKWKNSPFGSSTVCAAGCGPASFAMMATMLLGRDITPDETSKIAGDAGMYINGVGSSGEVTRVLAEHYGLQYERIPASSRDEAIEKITQYLKNGWMIHVSGGSSHGSGDIPFSQGGHYIGIRGITNDGKWLLADSGHVEKYSLISWNPMDVMVAGLSLGNIHAIRSSGSISPNYCSSTSSNNSTTSEGSINGGLTKAQAQRLADYYNDPTTKFAYNKMNCVAFSKFFVDRFTNNKKTWSTGDGRDTAHNIASVASLSEGNTPQPFSVFSVTEPPLASRFCGSIRCGHTGIVVAVNGDELLTIEAGYQTSMAKVRTRYISQFKNKLYGNSFTYLNDIINQSKLAEVVGQ